MKNGYFKTGADGAWAKRGPPLAVDKLFQGSEGPFIILQGQANFVRNASRGVIGPDSQNECSQGEPLTLKKFRAGRPPTYGGVIACFTLQPLVGETPP